MYLSDFLCTSVSHLILGCRVVTLQVSPTHVLGMLLSKLSFYFFYCYQATLFHTASYEQCVE